ncbi:aldehyde dehydrogenase family protein [Sinorhizobium medicae]|nr:aldehyde dehydrogenase family protein [Sinorhizobium medicae]MQV83783.1 aldehyde dehydrogenase family protein [Sinorhizobium medicae]MQV91960.1 aldehyde dehydrogenase family protein [Sinorhizobium medicae]
MFQFPLISLLLPLPTSWTLQRPNTCCRLEPHIRHPKSTCNRCGIVLIICSNVSYKIAFCVGYGSFRDTPRCGSDGLIKSPWNSLASMVAPKIPPALAAGCTVVLKPAEQTTLVAGA